MIQELFEYGESGIVKPTPYAYTVKPFRSVIHKATSNDIAIRNLAFVFYFCDIRSPYSAYTDKVKVKKIAQVLGMPKEWHYGDLLKRAVSFYKEYSTDASIKALEDLKETLVTIGNFSNVIRTKIEENIEDTSSDNITEVVSLIDDLVNIASKVPKIVSNMEDLYTKVKSIFSGEKIKVRETLDED